MPKAISSLTIASGAVAALKISLYFGPLQRTTFSYNAFFASRALNRYEGTGYSISVADKLGSAHAPPKALCAYAFYSPWPVTCGPAPPLQMRAHHARCKLSSVVEAPRNLPSLLHPGGPH